MTAFQKWMAGHPAYDVAYGGDVIFKRVSPCGRFISYKRKPPYGVEHTQRKAKDKCEAWFEEGCWELTEPDRLHLGQRFEGFLEATNGS